MKLIVFKVEGVKGQALVNAAKDLTRALKASRTKDNGRFGYAITSVAHQEGMVTGVIYQEYHGGQVKMDPKTKVVEQIPDNPWDETVFILLPSHGLVFFEKKRYSPVNLNYQTTLARFQEILDPIWRSTFGKELSMKKLLVGGDMAYFRRLFSEHTVRRLEVTGLYQKKIASGTKLHNPNPSRDESWASSWNDYDSEELEEITLKARSGKELRKSVIAKAILATDAVPKRIEVYDEAEDEYVAITKESQKQLTVDAPRQLSGPTRIQKALERILREIEKGASFLGL